MITYSILAHIAYIAYVDTIKMHQSRNDIHLMQYSGAAISQQSGVSILPSSLSPSLLLSLPASVPLYPHPSLLSSFPPSPSLSPFIPLPSLQAPFPLSGALPSEAS